MSWKIIHSFGTSLNKSIMMLVCGADADADAMLMLMLMLMVGHCCEECDAY
jgi:hypothetical protein